MGLAVLTLMSFLRRRPRHRSLLMRARRLVSRLVRLLLVVALVALVALVVLVVLVVCGRLCCRRVVGRVCGGRLSGWVGLLVGVGWVWWMLVFRWRGVRCLSIVRWCWLGIVRGCWVGWTFWWVGVVVVVW